MLAVVSLLAVKVVARVLFAMVKLLMVKVARETVGEASEHEDIATSMLALPGVACSPRVLSIATGGSSNSQLQNSPSHTSKMADLLPERPIDYIIQRLQVG